ncbi:hypothetical protein BDV06DRAFT_232600 [Aspergillus oleicola]
MQCERGHTYCSDCKRGGAYCISASAFYNVCTLQVLTTQASGNLGKVILEALTATNKYTITIFARRDSTATFPATVLVKQVDYDSIDDLTPALVGQDVVISTVSTSAVDTQEPLIRAAIAADVKRFIPSEFSPDIANPLASKLPQYAPQLRIQSLLQNTVNKNPGFSYTSIRNGPFLDWGLAMGFQLDLRSARPPFYDGGDRPFSTTTLATVARAVVRILDPEKLGKTTNRALYVHDVVPSSKWGPVPVDVSTEEMERVARVKFARGERDLQASMGFFVRAVLGEGYGGCFEHVDNEMLGLEVLSEGELEGVVRGVLESFE